MTLTRRSLLQTAGGLALALPLLSSGCSLSETSRVTGNLLRSKAELPVKFTVPLPVPEVLKPSRTDATTDYYEIVQRESRQQILPGLMTSVWGYNGTFPGPTLESRSGRRTVVRHRNELPVPTVTHLHGGRTPADSDGYPTDLVLPVGGWPQAGSHLHDGDVSEGERDYVYPLEQRAATLWYHDHRMDFTGPAVWRGLAGFHIVRDDEEDALDLPRGEREIPLLICDRSFDGDGALRYPSRDPSLQGDPGVTEDYMDGVLGDVVLVNGAPWPVLEVAATSYRFRILNASNARRFELALDPVPGDHAFVQIGSDGGLLSEPRSHESLRIAQAERFDVIVDFSSCDVGSEITLTNRIGEDSTSDVMRFKVVRDGPAPMPIPDRLANLSDFEALSESDAAVSRRFDFDLAGERRGMDMWTINGELFDPGRMDAEPVAGSTEVWELVSDPAHPIHLHQVPFKVLSRTSNDDRPLPTDAGWKDTIDLTEGEKARILIRFDDYRGRYVFHCHNLEHEDMAMMANFRIV